MNTLFSIIVPIYKVEPYLRECVDSLIGQTYQNIEIILVDDGSPDDCPAICDEYAAKDSRVRVLHKENGGVTSARKAAAEAAKGDYVLCVDGDDFVAPQYAEKFADCILKTQADVVCCQHVRFNGTKAEGCLPQGEAEYYDRAEIEKRIFPQLIQTPTAGYFAPSLCTKAIRRDLYLHAQREVDNRMTVGEDGVCMIPVLCHAQSMCILPDCLYYYRVNNTSITKGRKPFSWDGPRLIDEHLRKTTSGVGYDFAQQIDRRTAHDIFNVAVSQFYREEPYRVIRNDVRTHLAEPLYARVIRDASFSGSRKAALMMWALRHQSCILMYLWSRLK